MKQPTSRSGYVAIISALIISGLVVVIALSLGLGAQMAQTALTRSYYKEVSRALAEGCLDEALLQFAQDPAYAGNATLAIGADTCSIVSVEAAGDNHLFRTRAVFLSAATNLEATVANNLAILGWEEPVEF
jgi:hypothetical protein